MAKNNPLDAFVSDTPNTNSVQIPAFPKLEALVREHGMMGGLKAFDDQMEQTRQNLIRTINERLQGKTSAVSGSKLE